MWPCYPAVYASDVVKFLMQMWVSICLFDFIPGRLLYLIIALLTLIILVFESFKRKFNFIKVFKRSIGSKFDELDFDICSADKSDAQYIALASLFSKESGFECFNILKVGLNSRFYKFEEGKEKLDKILTAKGFFDRQ